jgi:excisionase family DNA binding protein
MDSSTSPFDALLQTVLDRVRQVVREEVESALKANPRQKLTYDIREAALLLNVPESWLGAAARNGTIRSFRLGHYVRFRLVDLEEFIESRAAANA